MRIKMMQDFDGAKAGDELEVDSKRGCYLQGMGAAFILEHDLPGKRAKASKMVETAQSKAVKESLEDAK